MSWATQDYFRSTNGWHSGTVANFNALTEGRSRSKESAVTDETVPWSGGLSVIQVGGTKTPKIGLTVYLPSATEVANLLDCVGDSGELVYGEGTFSAFCANVDASEYGQDGEQTAKVEFWILA